LYLSDLGLFWYLARVEINNLLDVNYRDDLTGILAENYFACELTSKNIPLRYWNGKRSAEVDFLIEKQNEIIPIEVKAGVRVSSESLNIYRENYKPKISYRISAKNFGLDNGIKSIPLYAVFCIDKDNIK